MKTRGWILTVICSMLLLVAGITFASMVLVATGFGKRIIVVVDLDKSWCDGFIIRVRREAGNPDIAYLQHTEKQTDTGTRCRGL